MWERFSYYGMRALLILFLTAQVAQGGLGFDVVKAGAIYGLYTSMVYMMSLPGGWVADRFLGQRRAVLLGGVFIALGNFCLALPRVETFYLGLVVIVLGTGLLKPNISTMVGHLYQQGDARRDAGFSLYYMGINLGAFLAPLACGYVGQRIDWHLGFGLAGAGMNLGLVQYLLGGRHLAPASSIPVPAQSADQAVRHRRQLRLGLLGLLGVPAALIALEATGLASITAVGLSDAFGVVLLVTVVAVFCGMLISRGFSTAERKRILVITILFLAASLFWSSFEQAGSTLNLFAQQKTDNRLFGIGFPSSWFQSLNAVFLVCLAPAFAWLWIWLGEKDPSLAGKFALGLLFVGLGFAVMAGGAIAAASGTKVSPMWLTATYLFHTIGELCLSPVGLSAITKLAPARVAGLMMGAWFLSNSTGNYLGGRLASFYESLPLETLFGAVAAFGLAAGLLLALFIGPMRRLTGEVR